MVQNLVVSASKNALALQDRVSRNNYTSDFVPQKWGEGAFSGNGLLGCMVLGDGDGGLRWEIGRTDVMDRSFGELNGQGTYKNNDCAWYRLPVGALELQASEAGASAGTLENDIWNGEVKGSLQGENGIRFRTITHTTREVILIEWETTGAADAFAMGFRPAHSGPLNFAYGVPVDCFTLNPPPSIRTQNQRCFCTQSTLSGGCHTTAYDVEEVAPARFRLWATVQRGGDDNQARQAAARVLDEAKTADWDALWDEHNRWWHTFWERSWVCLPDARLQAFYFQQSYKIACATRADRPCYDLLGPWTHRTVWAACWWNLNAQLQYLPLYAANRLDLAESLVRVLRDNRENLRRNGEHFGLDILFLPRASNRDLLTGPNDSAAEWCNLPWICHNLWLHYRYSMDAEMGRTVLFPLLRGAINLYLHLLQEGEGGLLHLPVGESPEYGEAADTNINLFLLRWGCQTLLGLEKELGLAEPLSVRWQEVLARLTPPPVDSSGALMIGRDVPYDRSHRHFSHLLGIYPLHLLPRELPQSRALMERSVENWLQLDSEFAGYSWTGAASLNAVLGRGEDALKFLQRYLDTPAAQPNTFYLEHGGWAAPCAETPCSVNSALQEMLLQSWDGAIHVFPAVPESWRDCSFHQLRAEGAFVISARREEGKTVWLHIESEVGSPCRVKTDIANFSCTVPFTHCDGMILLEITARGTAEITATDIVETPRH